MTIIKLKRYYPYLEEEITLEVTEAVAKTLSMGGRLCDSYKRRKRANGERSLDTDTGYEGDVLHRPITPEELLEKWEDRAALYTALSQLPPVQARRVYRYYILDMRKSEIAAAEGVDKSRVCHSIEAGLDKLKHILKNSL